MSRLKDTIREFADYCSTGLAKFGTMPNDEEHLDQLIAELKRQLIGNPTPIEKLDEMNQHLDSRSKEYWHAHNVGYLAALQKVEDAIDGTERKIELS